MLKIYISSFESYLVLFVQIAQDNSGTICILIVLSFLTYTQTRQTLLMDKVLQRVKEIFQFLQKNSFTVKNVAD
jgi:hypothetical protein